MLVGRGLAKSGTSDIGLSVEEKEEGEPWDEPSELKPVKVLQNSSPVELRIG
jgi:hypothetical protein